MQHQRTPGNGGPAAERGSSADWAFEAIFDSIVSARLSPGAPVTEEALGRFVPVSRTPLREAIRRLEMAGLLVRQRNRALRVADLSLEEMRRLSMLREAIEALLVRHVATRYAAGEITLEALEQLVEQMEAIDPERGLLLLLRLGGQFHEELSLLSGDPLGARLLKQVLLSFERYRRLIDHQRDRAQNIAQEHGAIIHAIRSGNEEDAANAIAAHLRNAREIYTERLSRWPGAD